MVACCVCFLTEKKDCNLYKKLFTTLKNVAEQMDLVFNPKIVVTHFEQAAMNAYKIDWPDAELKCWFFHFNQAILLWDFRNGFKLHYTIQTKFNTWLKMILSLPVIPVDRLMDAWRIIKNNRPADLNVQPIIDYFKSKWVNGYIE